MFKGVDLIYVLLAAAADDNLMYQLYQLGSWSGSLVLSVGDDIARTPTLEACQGNYLCAEVTDYPTIGQSMRLSIVGVAVSNHLMAR